MGELLGDTAGAGGPDELRAIVAMAGRRMRLRAAATAGVVALIAGGGVGYAVSGGTGGSGRQVVATSGTTAGRASSPVAHSAAGGAQSAASPSYAVPEAARFTRLFTRQANGVDVRGFLITPSVVLPQEPATCPGEASRFQAEVSTPGMVGVAGGGFLVQQLGPELMTAQPSILGAAEGDPVAVVIAETSSSVAKLRMVFTGGATDEMTPVNGWSVLAAPAGWYQQGRAAQQTVGTLTALDSAGHSLVSTPVLWPPGPTPGAGSSGSGSGTAGSGTISSGTATSGTATTGSGKAAPNIAYPCGVSPPVLPCAPAQGSQPACVTPAGSPEPAGASTSAPSKGSGG